MNYSVVDQIPYVEHKFLFFFICYFDVLSLTFGPLSSEQPYSPDVNNWSLAMLCQVWFPKPGLVPSVV